MPPVSRRQRAYDQRAGQRKARNIFAVIFLLLAATTVVLFFYFSQRMPPATIYVSLQNIAYSNSYDDSGNNSEITRLEIPYQSSSTQKVKAAFENQFENVSCESGQISGNNAVIGMIDDQIDEMNAHDISLLYVNGHLKKSRKDGDFDVTWVYPDGSLQTIDDTLDNVLNLPTRLKVLLVDAGQYSWNPNHPNRKQDSFHDKLSEKIKQLDPKSNLWVVLSHSEGEISFPCTPKKTTLFSLAIEESLKNDMKTSSEISVAQLFQNIYFRCVAYSKNFDDDSLQHPQLFRAGEGRIDTIQNDDDLMQKISFVAKPGKNAKSDEAEKIEEIKLASHFRLRNESEKRNWLQSYNTDLHSKPVLAMSFIQTLTEAGQNIEELELGEATTIQAQQQQNPLGDELQKFGAVESFRKNCCDLAVQMKITNLLSLLQGSNRRRFNSYFADFDNVNNIDYDNIKLKEQPDFTAILGWNDRYARQVKKLHEDWIHGEEGLVADLAQYSLDETRAYTPLQLEILGNLKHRLLPFANFDSPSNVKPDSNSASTTKTEKPAHDSLPEIFQMSLEFETGLETLFDGKDHQASTEIWKQAKTNYQQLFAKKSWISKTRDSFFQNRDDTLNQSDSLRRLYLALVGSEGLKETSIGVVGIKQKPVDINLSIQGKFELFEGHNFFRASLRNAHENYRVKAKLEKLEYSGTDSVSETGAEPNQTEADLLAEMPGTFSLFEKQEESKTLSSRKRETSVTAKKEEEFVFYVFISPGSEDKPESITFQFSANPNSAESTSNPPKPKNVKFEVVDGPRFQTATRRLGKKPTLSKWEPIQPWKIPSNDDFRLAGEPLKLHTLANLKAKFELAIKNHSSLDARLDAELYMLPDRLVRSDLVPDYGDFFPSFWDKSFVRPGVEDSPTVSELIASYSSIAVPGGNPDVPKFLTLSARKTPDKTKDEGNDVTSDLPAALPKILKIDRPMLLVFFDSTLDSEHKFPIWFQLVEIEPDAPFDTEDFKFNNKPIVIGDLLGTELGYNDNRNNFEKFEQDVKEFTELLPADESLASTTTFGVSELHFLSKQFHEPKQLDLKAAIYDEPFISQSPESEIVAMIDVIGIPNYLSLKIENKSDSPAPQEKIQEIRTTRDSRIRTSEFAGIRILSDFWESNHSGFVYDDRLFGNDEPIAGRLYLRKRPEAKGDRGKIQIELALPFLDKYNSPVSSETNFALKWRGSGQPNPLVFPTKRAHFLITDSSTFVSSVSRHVFSPEIALTEKSGNSNLELSVIDRNNRTRKIGEWIIATGNPNSERSLAIEPDDTITSSNQTVTVDWSNIVPDAKSVAVSLKGNENKYAPQTTKFFKRVNDKKYEFRLYDLIGEATGLQKKALMQSFHDQGSSTISYKLILQVIDYFDTTHQIERDIAIRFNRKKKSAPASDKSSEEKDKATDTAPEPDKSNG